MRLRATYQLVELALSGDGDARGELLERLRPRLVLWCASRMSPALREKLEPEDAAQEVLLLVHRDLDDREFEGQEAFFGWFFTVAENRIRDLVDHHGAIKRQQPEPRSFHQTTPSEFAARQETADRLREAIEQLPDEHREVVRLKRLEERPTREIAEIMDRSEGAVRVLYCRALRRLRDLLAESG